jgi:hypothetical protein
MRTANPTLSFIVFDGPSIWRVRNEDNMVAA